MDRREVFEPLMPSPRVGVPAESPATVLGLISGRKARKPFHLDLQCPSVLVDSHYPTHLSSKRCDLIEESHSFPGNQQSAAQRGLLPVHVPGVLAPTITE